MTLLFLGNNNNKKNPHLNFSIQNKVYKTIEQFYNGVVIIFHFWVTTFFRGLNEVNYFTPKLSGFNQTKYFRDDQRKGWRLTLKTKFFYLYFLKGFLLVNQIFQCLTLSAHKLVCLYFINCPAKTSHHTLIGFAWAKAYH